MIPSRRFLAAASSHRVPLIKFLGKRSPAKHNVIPETPATEPHPHPAAPSNSLPDSFMAYRSKAQQHGPLARQSSQASSSSSSNQSPSPAEPFVSSIGARSGKQLGSVLPPPGQALDISELPARYGRLKWTESEIEAVELGGAGVKLGWGGS